MTKVHFLFLLLVTLLGSTSLKAQDIKLHKKKIEPSVHGRYLDPPKYDSFFFGLPDIRYSDFQRHARLAFHGCIVDLYQSEGMPASGTIIYHIDQRPKRNNSKKLGNNLSYSQVVDAKTSAFLLDYLLDTPFDSFQNDTLVSPSLDSLYRDFGSVSLEIKTDIGYQEFYSSRWAYGFMEDIDISFTILNYGPVTKQLQVETGIKILEGLLSNGRAYAYDGGTTHFYLLTKRQSKRWFKNEPHRNYIDSVEPQIDSFIKQVLNNTPDSFQNWSYSHLYIKFNKKGQAVQVRSTGKRREYAFDKEFRAYRKRLISIFKEHPISFIIPERSYWREVFLY